MYGSRTLETTTSSKLTHYQAIYWTRNPKRCLNSMADKLKDSPLIGHSLTPTRYRLQTSSGEAYVKCGADILLNGLRFDLEGEARCPICEQPIRFRIQERQIKSLKPADALLYVVESSNGAGGICIIRCEATNIFDRRKCLLSWLGSYKDSGGTTYTLNEYLSRFRAETCSCT